MIEYTEKECEELEGNEIEFQESIEYAEQVKIAFPNATIDLEKEIVTYIGVVVGCHPDIGLTITSKENKKINIICILGPLAPSSYKHKLFYEPLFNASVKMVKDGVYRITKAEEEAQKYGYQNNGGRIVDCPFT